MNNKVFAFDLGSGSIGECVRHNDEIKHLDSLLLDSDFASVKDAALVRRAYRTRLAHAAREAWWRKCAAEAGLETPGVKQDTFHAAAPIPPDPRMLREFAAEGDDTLYTSCLLRIALLQGQKLASWQVYKAVHSAMQHRGYDAHLPWKGDIQEIQNILKANETLPPEERTELTARQKKIWEDAQKESAASGAYAKALEALPEAYRLPCYYEAWRMGLWSADQPTAWKTRVGAYPAAARNKGGEAALTAPRKLVERELRLLLEAAAAQYPALAGKTDYILYGPAEKAYAPVVDKQRYAAYRGREWEWQGVLAQKTPRFDNRALSDCCLMERFHVCKASDPLSQEVSFLLGLKNMRFTRGASTSAALTAAELRNIFERYRDRALTSSKEALTKTMWKNELAAIGGVPNENQLVVPAPRRGGRSRFCRPALQLLKELILSGESPHAFHARHTAPLTNTDPLKGLVKADFDFLLSMPDDWNKLHIPDSRQTDKALTPAGRKEAVADLLADIKNHVVRHRLLMLLDRLDKLTAKYGEPDYVMLEVVRQDFMGKDELDKLLNKQKKQREANLKAAQEAGIHDLQKMRLFHEQNCIDLYATGEERHLATSDFGDCDIDHIVPQSRHGADSQVNKVLTRRKYNDEKGNRTPYEWLHDDAERWSQYLANIKAAGSLSNAKKELLVSDCAEELERRRNDLQATAYLEKLAQRVVALFFGWGLNTQGDARRVYTANGAQTARVRRAFGLDRLLHSRLSKEEFVTLARAGELDKKNRENKKHHALDALALSIIRHTYYDEKGRCLRGPAYFTPPFCARALEQVFPRNIRSRKQLEETVYGLRERTENGEKQYFVVTRYNNSYKNFIKLADARKNAGNVFDTKIRKDMQAKLADAALTQEAWQSWWNEYTGGGKKIRKLTRRVSGPYTAADITLKNGRRQIGEFFELGKMKGQFKKETAHRGQLVYKDAKGKWRVEPVYLWESVPQKLAEYKKKYGKVIFLRAGDLLEVQKSFPCGAREVPVGVYRLDTLETKGTARITHLKTLQKLTPQVGALLDKGYMKKFVKE